MSSYADTEAYETMISALNAFQGEIETVAASLALAVQDCIDNMEGDPHAVKRSRQIVDNLPKLLNAARKAGELAQGLKKELNIITEVQ